MKLVIMIPCLNEETTLPLVLANIPRKIVGIDSIKTLIIDDGCTDRTVEVAKNLGIKYFIHHARTRGLATSLKDGMTGALELGADIIVLTDGDNQYPQEKIPDLIKPIMDGVADMVIADRQTQTIEHFSPIKKFLQRFGTAVMNSAAGTSIPDATSGFRAYNKESAIRFNLIGKFNFAMETTVQAANNRLAIADIKIKTNPKTRESRLFKSNWEHVRKSAVALMNAYTMYKPFAVFMSVGIFFFIAGLIPFANYIVDFITQNPDRLFGAHHLQSLIIGTVLLNASFISFTLGIVANLIRINRVLIEDVLYEQRHQKYDHLLKSSD
jgi:glycosyltransferase involved in cell wall biosynthesis